MDTSDIDCELNTRDYELRQAVCALQVFDINRDGLIDQRELLTTMKCLGEEVSNEDVLAMIRAADKNNDGKIDYEGLSLLVEYFFQLDTHKNMQWRSDTDTDNNETVTWDTRGIVTRDCREIVAQEG